MPTILLRALLKNGLQSTFFVLEKYFGDRSLSPPENGAAFSGRKQCSHLLVKTGITSGTALKISPSWYMYPTPWYIYLEGE